MADLPNIVVEFTGRNNESISAYRSRSIADASTLGIRQQGPLHDYIPSPTWRPIAELPPEWMDWRRILIRQQFSDGTIVVQTVFCHRDMVEICKPTHYLDLAIPDPPR